MWRASTTGCLASSRIEHRSLCINHEGLRCQEALRAKAGRTYRDGRYSLHALCKAEGGAGPASMVVLPRHFAAIGTSVAGVAPHQTSGQGAVSRRHPPAGRRRRLVDEAESGVSRGCARGPRGFERTVTLRDIQPARVRLFSGWFLRLRALLPLFPDPLRTVLAVKRFPFLLLA